MEVVAPGVVIAHRLERKLIRAAGSGSVVGLLIRDGADARNSTKPR